MTADTGRPIEQNETWQLLNDELRLRLDVQRTAFNRIEGRAALILGAVFAAIQFVAGKDLSSPWLSWALGAYGVAMATSLCVAALPRRFEEVKPRSIVVGLWLYPKGRAAAELANNRLKAFEQNVKRQGLMILIVRVSVAFAIAGAILSVLHLTRGDSTNARNSAGRWVCPGASSAGSACPSP
ncbi:MAG: hypothetical protein ACLGI2_00065 [Acidimicrobiia bacterium]